MTLEMSRCNIACNLSYHPILDKVTHQPNFEHTFKLSRLTFKRTHIISLDTNKMSK